MPENKEKTFESDRILSYFQIEWRGLLAVTISGLIYNLGLIAGPWFERNKAVWRYAVSGNCLCGSDSGGTDIQIYQAVLCQTICQ